ncbi:uridylate kinase [Catellatospora methionotrophica]|uniref:Uridylate kinase n=1 Tax=Catellatospora methionotrophica TaxID=121620 RepID=A0A8J3LLC2_9ACTN|nr:UMP kinase [Catellatospora methionotrophica]GIG17316.1 uridylate kinase [Catellatospora methionotrophica]
MERVLLKMSGEAVVDVEGEHVISAERLDVFCRQIALARADRPMLSLSVVVGGGNILRGKQLEGVDRTKADYMGMLATVINALALGDAMDKLGLESRVMTGIEMPRVAEPFILGRALRHLQKNRIVIFAGGTGNPYFTTDTAAALRAAEIGAEVILLAKFGTDGVYDKDPRQFADAKKYRQMSFNTLMTQNLQVMDSTAVSLCRDNGTPIYVFDMEAENAVTDALLGGRKFGTLITESAPDVFEQEVVSRA